MFATIALLMLAAVGSLAGVLGVTAYTTPKSRGKTMAAPMDDNGFFEMGALLGLIGSVLVVILGAIILFAILGSTTGSLASNVKNTSNNVSTSDWGSTTANGIAPSFGLIISLVGLFVVVIAAAGVLYIKHKKHGKGLGL